MVCGVTFGRDGERWKSIKLLLIDKTRMSGMSDRVISWRGPATDGLT